MSIAPIDSSVEQNAWFASAECLGADPDTFFIERGGSTADAKAICKQCSVEDQCLDYALEHNETYGVWGGRSQPELQALRRVMRRAV